MKADLHIHTTFSDGISSPKEMVEAAIEKGINCICITDHGETKGAVEAMKFGFDKNILVIPGIEVLSKSGDILGINIKKIIPNGLSVQETIKEIRKQNGIAIIPHPFDRPLVGFWGGGKEIQTLDLDGIEIFNASVFFNFSNKKASKFSQINNLSFTAGSDAHRKEFVGRGYLETSENILSEKDLITAIMNKKVKIGGEHLNFFEILKNISNSDVKSLISYYRLRRKNGKNSRREFLINN